MGQYHCSIDLLFDWFGISCMTTEIFCFCLQNRPIQTSQTGGQWYGDTSPFSTPWLGGWVDTDRHIDTWTDRQTDGWGKQRDNLTSGSIDSVHVVIFIYKYEYINMYFLLVIIDVQSMFFIGFGFLMTFMKRFGYTAVTLTLLVTGFI